MRVTHIVKIHISESMVLTDVLYVPSFTFNLISITQLTLRFNTCLIFLANHCLIQVLSSWTKIRLAKAHASLYYLLPNNTTRKTNSSSLPFNCNQAIEGSRQPKRRDEFSLKFFFENFVKNLESQPIKQ